MKNSRARFALVALALTGVPAAAQEPPQDTKTTTLQPIEVVGSHIRRIDVETRHPLLTIERAELLRTGLTDVADILQTITANGQTQNRNINNGGNGELRVNLRSLGSHRTLVLVNGQRWAGALDGGVDLTAIPLALVERVEVLKDGASAIYGSDAIAGVINIVTRREFDGAELGAYFGQYDQDDGLRRSYDLTFGRGGDGWSAAIGLEYEHYDPVMAGSRRISGTPLPNLPATATGSSATPYTNLTLEGTYTPLRLIDGRSGTSPDDFRRFDSRSDNYNYQAGTYMQTPAGRKAVFAQGRYEISPSLALVADLLYNRRTSSQQLAAPVVLFSPFSSGPESLLSISPDNLYNPFGQSVIAVQRRLVEGGPRRFEQSVDSKRAHVGLDGLFSLAGRDVAWGADFTWIRADERSLTDPYFDNRALALAIGPSFRDAAGAARCGTPDAPIAGCVPLDLFGPPGSITPQMLDYIRRATHASRQSELRDFNLHASGTLLDLPAGGLGVAAGVEHRSDRGEERIDPLIQSGNANGSGGGSIAPTRGSDRVDEAYVEFDVPVLKDLPFARSLDVSLASRYSRYSEFGSTTNSQFGLRWKPFDDLLVRGNYSEGFRAPSLFELFAGTQVINGQFFDPCAAANEPGPSVIARCRALGVPPGVEDPQAVEVTTAGNPKLQPETATTRTLGLVYSPHWLEGLETSLDWYRIRLRGSIQEVDAGSVLDGCYLHADLTACSQIRRAADGTLTAIRQIPRNLPGGLETEGFDVGALYRRPTAFGDFTLRWENSYVTYFGEIGQPERLQRLADGSLAQGNVVGQNSLGYGTVWRLRSVLALDWQRERWNVSVAARYFSSIKEDCSGVLFYAQRVGDPALRNLCSEPDRIVEQDDSGIGQPAPRNRVGSVTFVDLDLGWSAPWGGRVTLGVRNALDRGPPVSYSAGFRGFFADYDLPGRFWYASYRQRF
ncbi:TonB-dependent receptor [Dokdonella sp.]|uniref:TonB-dependent receptor domain-containing protein n=1 Tax=Dokdonella sp. TaxID=2291710 RepID=UPI001B130070|nr:TonB-dependent receptor [Dokdonella sp.]MBO9661910.1 TonB-dependent receptor [Dokdonella sp.]